MKYISKETLQDIIDKSNSKTECLALLGLHRSSSFSYKTINYYIELYDADISKFTANTLNHSKEKIPLKEILDGKFPWYGTSKLRKRLIDSGIFSHECSKCLLKEWNGLSIPLDLDHINGIPTDHRLENIRLLCRNCHAQTSNFCGANIKKKIKIIPDKIETYFEFKPKVINDNVVSVRKYKQNTKCKISNMKGGYITEKVKADIEKVLNCDIDFNSFGWVTQLATLLNKKPQKINSWLKKYMPEMLETAFIRKLPSNV